MNINNIKLLLKEYIFSECDIDFNKITLLSDNEVEQIKKSTFRKWSYNDLWNECYFNNLKLILKYQISTNAPEHIIWNTIFHLYNNIKSNQESIDIDSYIYLWMINMIKYILSYWVNKPYKNDTFIEFTEEQKKQYKAYSSIWYNFWLGYCLIKWIEYPSEWKLEIDWLYNKIIDRIYTIFWWEIRNILYDLAPHDHYVFSILYEAINNHKQIVDIQYLRSLYSPYQFTIQNHPIANKTVDEIKLYIEDIKEKRIFFNNIDKSKSLEEFEYDCWYLNLIKQKKDYQLLYDEISSFKEKYYFIKNNIYSKNLIRNFDNDNEKDTAISQLLYFDMQQTIVKIKLILQESDIKNLTNIFHFLNDDKIFFLWYNNKDFIKESENKKRRNCIELSRIFLYQKISQKEFDWLKSIYEETKWDFLLSNLYNLVLWKFSLAFVKIWVKYFTEDYLLLLKTIFRNLRLQTPWKDMNIFNLPQEAWNDSRTWYWDNDDEIKELIFSDEWIDKEMKWYIIYDWKSHLQWKINKRIEKHSYIKPVCAFLNTNWGKIILWLREENGVYNEVKNLGLEILNINTKDLFRHKETNNHYLTWIDKDLEILWQNADQLKQYIDNYIWENIFPNPFTNNNPIIINIKKFFGKTICIMEVPKWNIEYYLVEKTIINKKEILKHQLYIRKNASDHVIKDIKEGIEYFKSRNI